MPTYMVINPKYFKTIYIKMTQTKSSDFKITLMILNGHMILF